MVAFSPDQPRLADSIDFRRAFGGVLAADLALERLPKAEPTLTPILRIADSGKVWNHPESASADRFHREMSVAGITYTAGGIGEFVIHDGGRSISYSLAADVSPGDVQHILTGPALVMALQLQGRFFLHSAAFELNDRMFCLAAPHGHGKSTLAASFHDTGYTVHSDDVVPLRGLGGEILASQGQPWMKLWDTALSYFGKDASEFRRVLNGLDKRVVPTPPMERDLPLGGIYLLLPHTSSIRPIEIEPLGPLDAALAVMAGVYSPEIVTGELAVAALDAATRIAETVPVRTISYYRSFENLPAIRDAILRDVAETAGA